MQMLEVSSVAPAMQALYCSCEHSWLSETELELQAVTTVIAFAMVLVGSGGIVHCALVPWHRIEMIEAISHKTLAMPASESRLLMRQAL